MLVPPEVATHQGVTVVEAGRKKIRRNEFVFFVGCLLFLGSSAWLRSVQGLAFLVVSLLAVTVRLWRRDGVRRSKVIGTVGAVLGLGGLGLFLSKSQMTGWAVIVALIYLTGSWCFSRGLK